MSAPPTLPELQALKAMIAPTPYHEAALENDIELAEEAFSDMIPFPRAEDYPLTFTPVELAMLPPCNYRLLTLFSLHGQRPQLSQTDSERAAYFQSKQATIRAFLAMHQNHIDSSAHSTDQSIHNAFDKMAKSIAEITPPEDSSTDMDNIGDDHERASEDAPEVASRSPPANDSEFVEFPTEHQAVVSTVESVLSQVDEGFPVNLPLPNRLILLVAVEMLEDTCWDEKQYINKLLARAIVVRSMMLLQDVASGKLNLDDANSVKHHVSDVLHAHQTVIDEFPLMNWELAVDLGMLSALAESSSSSDPPQ